MFYVTITFKTGKSGLIWQLTPDVANSSTVDETEDGEAVTTTATTGQPEIGGRDPRHHRETTTDEKTDTRPHVVTVDS
jgi:hypothetical protein